MFYRIQSGAISTIVPTEHLATSRLEKVYVGQSRDDFSIVETNHSIIGVCAMFGSFVKFVVVLMTDLTDEVQTLQKRPKVSESTTRGLPSHIAKEKNRKDQLYNAIIDLFRERGLGWQKPETYGKQFIRHLTNLFWYIDGHHEVLASRACPIPVYFSTFVGYNRPELSKHRKRSISNLSRDVLLEHATVLHDYAMSSWIQQPEWEAFKTGYLQLIEAISAYASYLAIRNKSMKRHHSSPEPAVSFADSCNIRHIMKSSSVSPLLSEIDSVVTDSILYQRICVSEYTPI